MPRASHICRLGATVQVLMLLGGATMALADDTVDIPLDLQAIPTVDDDDTWADVTQKRPLRWELATGERRETMAGPLDTLVRDSKAVGFASLALNADFVLAPGLSLQGRAILYTEGGATDLFLQRIKLEYAPASTPIRLSLGKDYLAWSFTDLAHVMDPSPLETAQIDATDTGDDYAHPYAMVQYASGPHQLSFAAMSEGHKFDDLSEDGHLYALRYERRSAHRTCPFKRCTATTPKRKSGSGSIRPWGLRLSPLRQAWRPASACHLQARAPVAVFWNRHPKTKQRFKRLRQGVFPSRPAGRPKRHICTTDTVRRRTVGHVPFCRRRGVDQPKGRKLPVRRLSGRCVNCACRPILAPQLCRAGSEFFGGLGKMVRHCRWFARIG